MSLKISTEEHGGSVKVSVSSEGCIATYYIENNEDALDFLLFTLPVACALSNKFDLGCYDAVVNALLAAANEAIAYESDIVMMEQKKIEAAKEKLSVAVKAHDAYNKLCGHVPT